MGHGGDVIEELTSDHNEVEELFTRIESLPAGHSKRQRLTDQAVIELVRHSVAEEEYRYPAVREYLSDGDTVADKEIEDHSAAERTMKQLEGLDADDPLFDQLLREVMTEAPSHVRDEESNLFPQPRTTASQEALMQLGEKVRQAKKTAPTRPHPSAPDTPPANKLLAPGDRPGGPDQGRPDRTRQGILKSAGKATVG
jgi:hemerythrin superfamily protein